VFSETQCFRKYSKANISQGSVVTCFKCGGTLLQIHCWL